MRWIKNESGMTLAEILVAVSLITIGLVALLQAFPFSVQGMEGGRQQSTAVFLAEQRLEQIKAWSLSTAGGQGFATVAAGLGCFTAGPCAAQAYNTIAGYPTYRINVATAADGATRTLVTVQVFYRPVMANAVGAERNVALRTLLTQR
jgi:Tfp pilus assembly protein PilV